MANIANTTTIAALTWLPVTVLEKPGELKPDIIVTTPHRGDVVLDLTEVHFPFLGLGATTQTEKQGSKIVSQLRALESDAVNFLCGQWLQTLKEE